MDGTWSLELFMRRVTRKQLLVGIQTSIDSFRSLPYVQSFLLGCRLTVPLQTELVVNMHVMVSDLHRGALAGQEGASNQHYSVSKVFPPINNGTLTIH